MFKSSTAAPEFCQNGTHQMSFCRKRMSATVKTGFYSEFRNPDAFFSQKISLYGRRTEITYLQNYFLVKGAVFIRIEIVKSFDITVQPRIHSCRKYHR